MLTNLWYFDYNPSSIPLCGYIVESHWVVTKYNWVITKLSSSDKSKERSLSWFDYFDLNQINKPG